MNWDKQVWRDALSRREMLALGLGGAAYAAAVPGETHQATGVKVGEMTGESARVWMRRTASSARLANGIVRKGAEKQAKAADAGANPNVFEGATPGAPGYLRVSYRSESGRTGRSEWVDAEAAADYAAQTTIRGLRPATRYTYSVETRATRNGRVDGEVTGGFRTLPEPESVTAARVAMLSCQMYCRMDRPDGFAIYESIRKESPDFLLGCGDNVYYDNEDPVANSEALARYHWQRMYSLPTLVDCLRQVGGYWQKDDHDTLSNDVWPAMIDKRMAPLTFTQGQRIFREQVPAPAAGKPMYRTVRVGRDLELWLPEGRDYRSPNDDPDGPEKTIWGAEQKRWIFKSLAKSTATWKVLVNPNPIVGPDRPTKNDNHANPGFTHESREIRRYLESKLGGSVISVCGDRHWQYHSVDPETGLHEFGCGPASDAHAAGTPGYDPKLHRFHLVKGGYLSLEVSRGEGGVALTMRHRNVSGATVHEHTFQRKA